MWRQEEADKPADQALSKEERVLKKCGLSFLALLPIGLHDNYFELGGDSIIVYYKWWRALTGKAISYSREMYLKNRPFHNWQAL
ncbi:hypothetical protein ACEQPO_02480 [Bacillus sp. SL00103]